MGGFFTDTYLDVNGVYRWKDSHQVPSEVVLKSYVSDQLTLEKCNLARARESESFKTFRSLYRG